METTVLQAKNQFSLLLRQAERGEEVIIRRGKGGQAFRLTAIIPSTRRVLTPDVRWARKVKFRDEDVWASEWKDER